MSSPHSPRQNHILAALPAADYARLLPDLELIPMPLGWAVYESGSSLGYLYFPTTAAENAVAHAGKTLKGIKSIYIKDLQAKVENNKIVMFRINANISFLLK